MYNSLQRRLGKGENLPEEGQVISSPLFQHCDPSPFIKN